MIDEDFIGQTYWTTISLKEIEVARKIAEFMAEREDEYQPTIFFGEGFTKQRNEKFNNNVDKVIEAITAPDVNYIALTNNDRKKREVVFGFTINMLDNYSVLSINVTHSYFTNEENLNKFLLLGKEMINITSPIYGKIHDIRDSNEIMGDEIFNILEKIPAAFWGNYFGQYYVQRIGREKLLAFDGYRVEEHRNGGMYIQTTATPMNLISSEYKTKQRKLSNLIGIKRHSNILKNTIQNIFYNK